MEITALREGDDTPSPLMEQSIEQDMLIRSVVAEMKEMPELERRINKSWMSNASDAPWPASHELKNRPEAADPASPVAESPANSSHPEKELGRRGQRK